MKKRFPRFSLRALVIAVLAIAVCWTLTATWGASSLYLDIPWKKEWRGAVLHVERLDKDGSVYIWDHQARAIIPFLLREHVSSIMPGGATFEYDRTYFWFFGYYREMNGPREALVKK